MLMGLFSLSVITMMAYDDVAQLTLLLVKTCEQLYSSIVSVIGLDALVIFDFLVIRGLIRLTLT